MTDMLTGALILASLILRIESCGDRLMSSL